MTKAELKRRLTPGTELTLVHCLVGPTRDHRTVKAVRSKDIVVLASGSHEFQVPLDTGFRVEETENGFRILGELKTVYASYVYGHV